MPIPFPHPSCDLTATEVLKKTHHVASAWRDYDEAEIQSRKHIPLAFESHVSNLPDTIQSRNLYSHFKIKKI